MGIAPEWPLSNSMNALLEGHLNISPRSSMSIEATRKTSRMCCCFHFDWMLWSCCKITACWLLACWLLACCLFPPRSSPFKGMYIMLHEYYIYLLQLMGVKWEWNNAAVHREWNCMLIQYKLQYTHAYICVCVYILSVCVLGVLIIN